MSSIIMQTCDPHPPIYIYVQGYQDRFLLALYENDLQEKQN